MTNREFYNEYFLENVINSFKERTHLNLFATLENFEEWLDEKYVEPKPLDDAERRYLRNIVLPFYNEVENIRKIYCGDNERIYITVRGCNDLALPYFKTNTMYKNMESNKSYTLKELGIKK